MCILGAEARRAGEVRFGLVDRPGDPPGESEHPTASGGSQGEGHHASDSPPQTAECLRVKETRAREIGYGKRATPAASECGVPLLRADLPASPAWPRFLLDFCRYRGERPVEERGEIDTEAVKRLFDPSRDPEERVREDDWFPGSPDPEWRSLYAHEAVGDRRRWYMNPLLDGRL